MSKPKIFLLRDGAAKLELKLPFPEADYANFKTPIACPACGGPSEKLGVQGSGKHPSQDDRAYEAEGYATCCKAHLGTIRFETGTFFGVREDEAMARLGIRIY
jgi:hypothetical protein